MREVSFFGWAGGGAGMRGGNDAGAGAGPIAPGAGAAGGRGNGVLATGGGGGGAAAAGGGGAIGGGNRGELGGRATGAGGGGTILRGGATECDGAGGSGLRANGGAELGRSSGGGVSSCSSGCSCSGRLRSTVSRFATDPSVARRGGNVMRTVSFFGSFGSAMTGTGEFRERFWQNRRLLSLLNCRDVCAKRRGALRLKHKPVFGTNASTPPTPVGAWEFCEGRECYAIKS